MGGRLQKGKGGYKTASEAPPGFQKSQHYNFCFQVAHKSDIRPNTWRLQSILDIEVFSRHFGYFQGISKVFSLMRVGTRLCQRLAVAQSTLTSLIEQQSSEFRVHISKKAPRLSGAAPRRRLAPSARPLHGGGTRSTSQLWRPVDSSIGAIDSVPALSLRVA